MYQQNLSESEETSNYYSFCGEEFYQSKPNTEVNMVVQGFRVKILAKIRNLWGFLLHLKMLKPEGRLLA